MGYAFDEHATSALKPPDWSKAEKQRSSSLTNNILATPMSSDSRLLTR